MSIWENLTRGGSADSSSCRRKGECSLPIDAELRNKSLLLAIRFIAENKTTFTSLSSYPAATEFVISIIGEEVADTSGGLLFNSCSSHGNLTDNIEVAADANLDINLSEIAGPGIRCSSEYAKVISASLDRFSEPQIVDSIREVWSWIQRAHRGLTHHTDILVRQKLRQDIVDEESLEQDFSKEKSESSLSTVGIKSPERVPSLRLGLIAADEILSSYFLGFVTGLEGVKRSSERGI